jgi:Predicted membrane protein (DUF2339)
MSPSGDKRMDRLEEQLRVLNGRVGRIERALGLEKLPAAYAARDMAPSAPDAAPREPAEAAPPRPAQPRAADVPPLPRREAWDVDLEELLGGRLLALVGGLAVILGLAFLVALAVERGWLDEGARTTLAFVGSAVLLAAGAWLHERRDRTQASLAIVGTGLAGLFLSLTAATVLYDLIAVELALGGAFVFGAIGSALAIRWNATPIGALGILGALAAPMLTGATANAQSLLFLAVAYAAAVAVLLWRRWEWMRVAAVVLVLLQVGGWVLRDEPSVARGFVVLGLFGALSVIAALGYELRRPSVTAAGTTHGLLIANASVLAILGAFIGLGGWEAEGSQPTVGWWLAGIAAAHALLGLALLRLQPGNRGSAITLLAIGLVAANVAFVVLVDGAAIPLGWGAAAAALALPTRALTRRAAAVYVVVGAQLGLAILHVLAFDAPQEALTEGDPSAVWPTLGIAASAFVVARLTPRDEPDWEGVLDATALAVVAYGTAVVVQDVWLVVAWAAEAVVCAELGRRFRHRVAAIGGLGFLVLGALHTLADEAAPESLVYGATPFWEAVVAVAALAVGALFAALRGLPLIERGTEILIGVAGIALVYLASIGIVSLFQPGTVEVREGALTVREQGQAILSAFWSLLGVGLLWAGLRRDERTWRLAGFGLLAIAVAKVFAYDMAALQAEYRVLSFVVLGLLLLAGAYAYQRMRRGTGTMSTPS